MGMPLSSARRWTYEEALALVDEQEDRSVRYEYADAELLVTPAPGGYQKRYLYQRAGVPEYWIVDQDTQVVERWRPGTDRPEILEAGLHWHPVPAIDPLVVDLVALFRSTLDD